VTFNPGVVYENGTFYMLERAAGRLRPFNCSFGLLTSADGFNFEHVSDKPVITPEMFGYPYGSIQDPRLVKIDDTYYLNYSLRPYSYGCIPTGLGVPEYFVPQYDGTTIDSAANVTRSGIARSNDLNAWEDMGFSTPIDIDDRDNALFPEKIGGRFALLRRPMTYVGEKYGCSGPAIWLSYSDDLVSWDDPVLVAGPEQNWEGGKIGAGPPPLKSQAGWIVLYHGVDATGTYRVGLLLLDLDNPQKVRARSSSFIMEPTEYYERFGLVIPNVVFPCGTALVDDTVYIYYGCCDTAISVATVKYGDLLKSLNI
jgi:predicted GH43/DUF377 family glycosyl hydrolase